MAVTGGIFCSTITVTFDTVILQYLYLSGILNAGLLVVTEYFH